MEKQNRLLIMDIDGCLAYHHEEQKKYFGNGKKDYQGFWDNMIYLRPNQWAIDLTNSFYKLGYQVVILTGRPAKEDATTELWLKLYGVSYDVLLSKPSVSMKSVTWKKIMGEVLHDNIALAVEDDPEIVEMYNSMGIDTLKARSLYEELKCEQ